MKKRIIFFDLDGTVLDGLSSEKSFFLYLLRHGYIGLKQFFSYWLFIFRWLPTYKTQVFIKNKAYLTGLSTAKITALAKKFVTANMIKKIRPRLMTRIKQHKKAGDLIVLLTGSPSFLAEIFAQQLGITEIQPTHCVVTKGKFTKHPPTQNPFAQEKLAIAQEFCAKHNINISDCAAYGNSIHDAILLSAVGQAVAVTPDKKLRKLAIKRKWEIID